MGLQRVRHDLETKQYFLYFSCCSLPPCSPLFVFFSSTMFCLKEERRSVDKKTSTSFSWEGKKSPWTGDSLCPLSKNLRNCICSALELLPRFPLWASNRRAWVKSCAGRQAPSESSRTTLPATGKGRQAQMMSSELLRCLRNLKYTPREVVSAISRGCVEWVTQSCPTLWPHELLAHQAPLSMGFSRQEYWSSLPFPSPGDLPNLGFTPRSPTL